MEKRLDVSRNFEYTPEQRQRIGFLSELLKQDLSSPNVAGFHGTSIEAVREVIKTGRLPGAGESRQLGNRKMLPGDISIYPNLTTLPGNLRAWYAPHADQEKMLRGVGVYAAMIAQHHSMAKALGLPLSDRRLADYAVFEDWTEQEERLLVSGPNSPEDDELFEDFSEQAKAFGVAVPALLSAMKQATGRKGVILGIGKAALEKFKIEQGDDFMFSGIIEKESGFGDLVIKTGGGLDYKDFAGFRILGAKETQDWANLSKNLL